MSIQLLYIKIRAVMVINDDNLERFGLRNPRSNIADSQYVQTRHIVL